MKYVALLRGINVGGNHTVEMKRLKALCEKLGYTEVSTYINSGNVLFGSVDGVEGIRETLDRALEKEFGFAIPTLVLSQKDVQRVVKAVPTEWGNDTEQKTDVAFLFPEVDSKSILNELPIKTDYADVRYVAGAVFWSITRKNLNKSQLNKLVGSKLYKQMTIRNVNTVRYVCDALCTK